MSEGTTTRKPRVLLVGWDGADWQQIDPLLDQGKMPHLQSIIEQGVMGNLSTLEPIISPMLWNSIATGKLADEHGVLGFTEPDKKSGAKPFSSASRKCKALWNMLTHRGMRSIVVNWWASHPAETIAGCVVSNHFVHSPWVEGKGWVHQKNTFHPARIAADVGGLRVRETEIDDQSILPFIPRAAEIDQDNDSRLVIFARHLAQCASIQAAGTHLMATEEWDFAAVYFEGIDHFCHSFMEFQAPKMAHIRQEDYEIYQDVVAGAYQFHDMMLGAMLQLIDEDTTVIVCSDHGFLSGSARPTMTPNEPSGPAYWHRPLGVLAMRGPGLKKDERIYGAGLLDLAPTILQMFGLPVGADMKGRVLVNAFEQPPVIDHIDSWENVEGECGMIERIEEMSEADLEAERNLVDQFAALGYIDEPGKDVETTARNTQVENDYSLAKAFLGSERPEKALPIMEHLVREYPWEHRFLVHLARCYYEAGYLRQALAILESAFPETSQMPATVLAMIGRIHVRLGELEEGSRFLELATASDPRLSGLFVEIARTYQRQRNWQKVLEAADRELENYPANGSAYQLRGAALLRMGDYSGAVEASLDCVGLQYWSPQAHFILGVSLIKLGDIARARHALELAVRMQPTLSVAHRILSKLYKLPDGDREKASFHAMQATEMARASNSSFEKLKSRKTQTFPLPDIPSPPERAARLRQERPAEQMGFQFRRPKLSGKSFVIVSGLPRSGTSLMMQMLVSGGMTAQVDAARGADENNPQGYYEWEAIKSLKKRPALFDLPGLEGKVIKVVSMLLNGLPQKHQYKLVFMMRPSNEVARSQSAMLRRLGTEDSALQESGEQLAAKLEKHRREVLHWLDAQSNIEVLTVDYPQLISHPGPIVAELRKFLGEELLPRADEMADVIRPDLYRSRTSEE